MVNQQIIRFDISMNYSTAMSIIKANQNLQHVCLDVIKA